MAGHVPLSSNRGPGGRNITPPISAARGEQRRRGVAPPGDQKPKLPESVITRGVKSV